MEEVGLVPEKTEPEDAVPEYTERLVPPTGFFVALLLLIPALALVIAPLNPPLGLIIAPLAYTLIAVLAWFASPVIQVHESALTAGRAHIGLEYLGVPEGFRGDAARVQRGPALDGRAFTLLRGALPVVRIPVTDPGDPCPYWLISTRRPEDLVAALAAR